MSHITNPWLASEFEQLADELNAATRAGDLPDAYAIVSRLRTADAHRVAQEAGFGCLDARKHRAAFFADLQRQIAEAARRHIDAAGLMSLKHRYL